MKKNSCALRSKRSMDSNFELKGPTSQKPTVKTLTKNKRISKSTKVLQQTLAKTEELYFEPEDDSKTEKTHKIIQENDIDNHTLEMPSLFFIPAEERAKITDHLLGEIN